jgi:ornithine--oxo-acid transaminase
MSQPIAEIFNSRAQENLVLHESYLNHQMVRVLRTIGFDRHYVRGSGAYLWDDEGNRYLDLLSGFGVFALGRNHPRVIEVLKQTLEAETPSLVQMDASLLCGVLAERLLPTIPGRPEKIFFCNSGTEAVEGAIKFARCATGRPGIIYCDHAYHGLTMGSLSLTADENFRDGFGPMLGDARMVPFNDLAALEEALAKRDVAAFIVEPIQGKGVRVPDDDYLPEAARLCRQSGTLFIADEVQTGLGRTGKLWAVEHWGVEPDLLCMAKALSGGFVPVGAVATRRGIFERVYSSMIRAMAHSSTFGQGNLAMAAGLVTLEVLEDEKLVKNAAELGNALMCDLGALIQRYEFLKEVRGKGLMIALEFGQPESFKLKTAWKLLEAAEKGLFAQMVTVPLMVDHRILSQVAGHGQSVVKLLPPLVLSEEDRQWAVSALDKVIADTHRVPGAIWDLGKRLGKQALKARRAISQERG